MIDAVGLCGCAGEVWCVSIKLFATARNEEIDILVYQATGIRADSRYSLQVLIQETRNGTKRDTAACKILCHLSYGKRN